MHADERRRILLAVAAGGGTAGVLVLLFRQLPTLIVASGYLQSQLGLVFLFLGLLPVVAYEAETPHGRLVTVYLLVAAVGSIAALAALSFGFVRLVPYAGVSVLAFGVAAALFSVGDLAVDVLVTVAGVVACGVFSFGIIFVGVSSYRTGDVQLVLPFLLLAGGFFATTNALKTELAAT